MANWQISFNEYEIILVENYLHCNNTNFQMGQQFLTANDVSEIKAYIQSVDKEIIFLDMKKIGGVASRAFAPFCDNEFLDNIAFLNVSMQGDVYNSLSADLQKYINEIDENEKIIYFSQKVKELVESIDFDDAYCSHLKYILEKYVTKSISYLPSSGIYSNMSIDLKMMFEHPDDYKYIIGELYYKIHEYLELKSVDCLVAASKNSIGLAAILSSQLGIPVVYHSNIGQKYVNQRYADKVQNKSDLLLEKKRYLMIYDVICLGTEVRILNALVNAAGGVLTGAIGIVNVQSSTIVTNNNSDSILSKAICLINSKELGLNYRIALTTEELEVGEMK